MLLRGLMNIYTNQRAARQYGDRVLRESSVLRATYEVWSDIASERGLGFRFGDSGPLIHGELASGATLEVLVLENDEGHYHTLARARKDAIRTGTLTLRPHDPFTRTRNLFRRGPQIDPSFDARFAVRASDVETAREILTPSVREIIQAFDARGPELDVDRDEATLVLEGVELDHDKLRTILDLLGGLTGLAKTPYRNTP